MPREIKFLPPGPRLLFGEPWRIGKNHSVIVCDRETGSIRGADGIDARAYYGGNLVAESMDGRMSRRAVDAVNFCAGFHFPSTPYASGLIDLVDVCERLFQRLPEPPDGSYRRDHPAHLEYELWKDAFALLENLGRPQYDYRKDG